MSMKISLPFYEPYYPENENQGILSRPSGLVGVVRLPSSIPYNQIKSEIVPCWRLHIAGDSESPDIGGRGSAPALHKVRFTIEV